MKAFANLWFKSKTYLLFLLGARVSSYGAQELLSYFGI